MISLKLKNETRILNAFRNAPKEMAQELQKVMQKVALETAGKVKIVITEGRNMWKSPIDTGAMRRGIQVREVKPLKAIITPAVNTPYAIYVHEGTRKMKARPFFEITTKTEQKDIQRFFQAVIDNTIKKLKF